MQPTPVTFPTTRQGVRDLDQGPRVLPISAGPVPPESAVNIGEKERAISTVLGGALIGACLGSPSTLSFASALVGGALVYRGMSGHCELNRILQRNTAGPEHASAELAYRARS